MKFRVIALPAITLLAAGAWVASGHRAAFRAEEGNRQLQQQLATEKNASGLAWDSPPPPPNAAKPRDWKKLGTLMIGGTGSSAADRDELVNFGRSLRKMTAPEIVVLCDEIAALDLPKQPKDNLEFTLFCALIDKDPELAFDRFAAVVEKADSLIAWNFTTKLQAFAQKEPARATAWLDHLIASGALDSKSLAGGNSSRNRFEGTLIGVLVSTDSAAATARLAALPQNDRLEAIKTSANWLQTEESRFVLAKLIRDQLTAENQPAAVASIASNMLGNNDFSKVTKFLDQIQATAGDREKAVEIVAITSLSTLGATTQKLGGEDFETLRLWAVSQSPANGNKASGSILMEATLFGCRMNFDEAADLALQYRGSPGYEQILAGFLSGIPSTLTPQNRERARGLAEQISDPITRSQTLELLK
jgi:hypothetical protein